MEPIKGVANNGIYHVKLIPRLNYRYGMITELHQVGYCWSTTHATMLCRSNYLLKMSWQNNTNQVLEKFSYRWEDRYSTIILNTTPWTKFKNGI